MLHSWTKRFSIEPKELGEEKENILKHLEKTRSNPSRPKKIGLSAVRIFVAAVFDLWQYQRDLGVNTYPSPRTGLVSQVLKEMKRNEEGEKITQFVDKGIGTMIDSYTSEEELESLVSYFMERNTEVGLRDAGSFLLSHYALLRSHYARELELSDMHSLLMPQEGYTDCHALLLIMRKGKPNNLVDSKLALVCAIKMCSSALSQP